MFKVSKRTQESSVEQKIPKSPIGSGLNPNKSIEMVPHEKYKFKDLNSSYDKSNPSKKTNYSSKKMLPPRSNKLRKEWSADQHENSSCSKSNDRGNKLGINKIGIKNNEWIYLAIRIR